MTAFDWRPVVAALKARHDAFLDERLRSSSFQAGLSDVEIAATERKYGFRFPPDLRALLQTALLSEIGFPDWRSGNEDDLRAWLRWPAEGMCFDVEYSNFWLPEWGPRPAGLPDAFRICHEQVARAPVLIPLLGHRYIPDEPHAPGNPVFSVYQTDIIYYGFDLLDYLTNEFQLGPRRPWPEQVQPIRFWQELL
jgi:hypothetical protein